MLRPSTALPIGPIVIGAFAAALCACGRSDVRGPNVLVITLDSVRRDALSTYGRVPKGAPEMLTTPNIDRLAAEGVVMQDAHTTTSWTLPSHLALMTGHPDVVHGVDQSFHTYEASYPTLAEVLGARGYSTAGFFSGPFLEPQFGFGRGFERYEACYGDALMAQSRKTAELRAQSAEARAKADAQGFVETFELHEQAKVELAELSHLDVTSQNVTDAVLAELDRVAAAERPFFVFAHYFDPHYDYVPPPEHNVFDADYDGHISGHYSNGEGGTHVEGQPKEAGRGGPPGPPPGWGDERDLAHLISLYEGEMHWTDAQVGRVLARLDELGLKDDTLVVLLADHGEEFFEHGALGHRSTLFAEVLRLPMILRLPGTLPAGARVEGLVSIVDVQATILDVLGGPPVADTSSVSFLPLIRGEDDGAQRGVFGRIVLSASISMPAPPGLSVERVPGHRISVVETYQQGSIKITRRRIWPKVAMKVDPQLDAKWADESARMRGREELSWIDLEAHPDELAEDHSSDFSDARAREVLREFRSRYEELLTKRNASRVVKQDDELTTMLKGLGYVGEEDRAATDDFTLPAPGAAVFAR